MKAALIVAFIPLVMGGTLDRRHLLLDRLGDMLKYNSFDNILDMVEVLEAHDAAKEIKEMADNEQFLKELLNDLEVSIDKDPHEAHGTKEIECFHIALKKFFKCVAKNDNSLDVYICADVTWANFEECFRQQSHTTPYYLPTTYAKEGYADDDHSTTYYPNKYPDYYDY